MKKTWICTNVITNTPVARATIAAQKFDYEADYLLKRYSEVDLDLINDIVDDRVNI